MKEEMVESRKNVVGREEQVAHEHHQPAPGHQLGDLVQHGRPMRRRLPGTVHHRGQDLVELFGFGPRLEMGQHRSAKSVRPTASC